MLEQNPSIYRFEDFELNAHKRLLLRNGQPVPLSSKALDLLLTLIASDGRALTKQELMESLWADQIVEDANLTVTMSHLRKALGEKAGDHRLIVTIPGHGYRFVGELKPRAAMIVEQHTVSEIVIDEDGPESEFAVTALAHAKPTGRSAAIAKQPGPKGDIKNRSRVYVIVAPALLICLALAVGYFLLRPKKPEAPFQRIRLTRLTNSGKVAAAAISPDSKLIAYVLGEADGNSLWVQQVGTASNIRIAPPTKAEVWGLTFSPDGSHVYFNLFASGKADPELFRVPSLGGVVEKIPTRAAEYITFSPDGKRFAYPAPDSAKGFNYLMVSDSDGGNLREIARKPTPNSFETEMRDASWSPDGKTIACVVNYWQADASYSSIVGVDVTSGAEKSLSRQRWYEVHSLDWLKDGSGLMISARDKPAANNQVWFLPYPEGEARRITNDLSQYDWLGAAASSGSLVAVQTNTNNRIFVGEENQDANDFKEIASEVSSLSPVAWTPDGKVVFRSDKSGNSNLWIMNSDGSDRRQLTVNADVLDLGLCVSPDGQHIVFASQRSGKIRIWQVDANGGNLSQLTDGEADAFPQCSPNGNSIVFQRGISSEQTLWTVPYSGGPASQITNSYAKWPAISHDGKAISYFTMANGEWRFAVIPSAGGPGLQSQVIPFSQSGNVLRWSPDDKALDYVSTVGGTANIWALPLDGSAPKQITNFKSYAVDSFFWAPDGKRLVVTRSEHLSDVILIENSPQP